MCLNLTVMFTMVLNDSNGYDWFDLRMVKIAMIVMMMVS